jgi:hypothetical protein
MKCILYTYFFTTFARFFTTIAIELMEENFTGKWTK